MQHRQLPEVHERRYMQHRQLPEVHERKENMQHIQLPEVHGRRKGMQHRQLPEDGRRRRTCSTDSSLGMVGGGRRGRYPTIPPGWVRRTNSGLYTS